MLIPVEGKVYYEMKEKKIFFTKFTDVYSHDRHCHFNLLKPPDFSYIDFLGNIHMNIRMKQHVLLKITEPFTIEVRGTLLKPLYRLKKRKVNIPLPADGID